MSGRGGAAAAILVPSGTLDACEPGMAMRDIVDSAGVRWTAWDIRPDTVHPITRYESYLQGFLDGWLVFETVDGTQRRRLHPIPRGWAELPDEDVLLLLEKAEPTRAPAASRTPVASRQALAPETPVEGRGIRSFLYPGGRLWTVAEIPVQYQDPLGNDLGEVRTVLRFSAGRRTLDLLAWPPEWVDYDDAQLADLLYRAFPRTTSGRPEGVPARRRSDEQARPES